MRYQLKDKERQAQLDALSETNKFSDVLNREMCESFFKHLLGIQIHFGRLLEEHLHGGFVEKVFEYRAFIRKEEIEVIEDLNPGVWYPREKFDGNPNEYILVERIVNYDTEAFTLCSKKIDSLMEISTHFMYIERPEQKDNHPESI